MLSVSELIAGVSQPSDAPAERPISVWVGEDYEELAEFKIVSVGHVLAAVRHVTLHIVQVGCHQIVPASLYPWE